VCEDEFGFSFAEAVAPTWAPRGQTPVLKRVEKYRREISTLAALTISGKLYKRHFRGSINAQRVLQGLKHLRRWIGKGFVLIWDGSRAHRAKCVQAYLALHPEIMLERLPGYAPELNAEEYCHGHIKQYLKNSLPANVAQIRLQLDQGFARLRRRPDLLLASFHHAGLALNHLW
jgi:transposase